MIHLIILNLKQIIFDGSVESVTIPGEQGELTVLPNHLPIVTAIKTGTISAFAAGSHKYFESPGGIFEFQNNVAAILL